MIAEIPAGTTRRLTVRATTQVAGPLFAGANISVVGDGDLSNNNASTTAWVQAERDVELTAGRRRRRLGVGAVSRVPYTVRSRGPLPTGDVTLTISIPSSALMVDSIDAGGATCSSTDSMHVALYARRHRARRLARGAAARARRGPGHWRHHRHRRCRGRRLHG